MPKWEHLIDALVAAWSGICCIAYKLQKTFFMVINLRLPGLLQKPDSPSGLKYAGHLRESAKKSSGNSTSWDISSVLGYIGEEQFQICLEMASTFLYICV